MVTLERWWVCMGIRGRAKYSNRALDIHFRVLGFGIGRPCVPRIDGSRDIQRSEGAGRIEGTRELMVVLGQQYFDMR